MSERLSVMHPITFGAARDLAGRRAALAGHVLGAWVPAGILWSLHETRGAEQQATCARRGASAVAKPGHAAAGSAVTLSCAYVQLMRRLASSRERVRRRRP